MMIVLGCDAGKQICASPSPAVLIPSPESEEEEDCTEEEEQGEGYQAPLELMAEVNLIFHDAICRL